MALGLGKRRQTGISNIPNVLKGQNVLVPTGYGTATTNQTENFKYLLTTGGTTEIYTVPAGKTFYVSTATFANHLGGANKLSLLTAASIVLAFNMPANESVVVTLPIPIKFSAGTVLSGTGPNTGSITLVGWEE